MNSNPTIQLHPQRARRGIALVITLLLLVLLSAFAVAFFTRMSVEQASANSYADGVTTRQLAESAVGLVESQIREATTVPNGAWGSQPGMIRTFARAQGTTTAQSPNPYAYYKLYSSDNMTITETGKLETFNPAEEIDPDWAQERALWTDLNEPVLLKVADPADASNSIDVKRYPIFDPDLAADSDTSAPATLSMHNTTPEVKVEGYTIDSKDTTAKGNERGRMPVRWIYVLRDGTLTTPTRSEDEGLKALWESNGSSTNVPTKANPIVGRVAFWADDDTSKVNINTAGGFTTKDVATEYDPGNNKTFSNYAGGFWDTPRFYTRFEVGGDTDPNNFGEFRPGAGGLAISQPPANEFQRFPGHPATTSLALLFNRTLSADGTVNPSLPRISTQQLYRLLPRLMPGGTEGGTDRLLANNNTGGVFNMSDSVMPLKSQRLYATVDEFFFAAKQDAGGNRRQNVNELLKTPDGTDPRNLIPAMTEDLIGQGDLNEFQAYRFLLTAHSRSPELNLFGRPRISIWPTWASGRQTTGVDYSARRNPIERLMTFSSTLGPLPKKNADGSQPVGKLFMFQRWNPYHPSEDVSIKRNDDLLKSYLTGTNTNPGLTEQPVPGFTSGNVSFATKYNGGENVGSRDQILAQIFDYIRSGVNLRDTYFDKSVTSKNYRDATAAEKAKMDEFRYAPRGVVVPAAIQFPNSKIPSSKNKQIAGFGRFPTVSEVSLVFYHAGYKDGDTTDGGTGKYFFDPRQKNNRPGGVRENLMRMFILVETYSPMQGYGRTEATNRDDRNKTPERITHFMEITRFPEITLDLGPNGPGETIPFRFKGGQLTNELRFSSGNFVSGSDAGGMEGTLHTFGLRIQETDAARGQAEIAPEPPDTANSIDPYSDAINDPNRNHGPYEFQADNAIRVPITANPLTNMTCRFSGMSATLRVRFGTRELQLINLEFPPAVIPVPTDAFWEDPGGFGFPIPDAGGEPDRIIPTPSNFNTAWSGAMTTSSVNWPWASGLLNYPAAMKSLAHRIWWINCVWTNGGRAYSGTYNKFINGQELFGPGVGFRFDKRWRNIIQPGDVVRSLVPAPAASTDLRTIALARKEYNNETIQFEPLRPEGPGSGYDDPRVRHVARLATNNSISSDFPIGTIGSPQAQLLRNGGGTPFVYSESTNVSAFTATTGMAIEPRRISQGPVRPPAWGWERKTYGTVGNAICFGNLATLPSTFKVGDYGSRAGELPSKQNGQPVNGAIRTSLTGSAVGDFDTGYGDKPDGALCNKPDEGHLVWRVEKSLDPGVVNDPAISNHWDYTYPYFTGHYREEANDTFFSPTRQIPSAVMFGSLLAGAKTGWQTLCFSPNPSSLNASTPIGKTGHPGMDVDPKDHLLLDLFQMPVVEPYAITEPFSTAGKVNLNCEIVPFNYIRRTTALRAALHPLRIAAVNSDQVKIYKGQDDPDRLDKKAYKDGENYRIPLNRDETIKSIASIFEDMSRPATDRFYKSASQICERFLYPDKTNVRLNSAGPKWSRTESAIKTFWQDHNLGGDNTREKPYADLYPRLTTKSNTYTVHVRVQKLRPQKGQDDEDFLTWNEGEDVVAAEYRGEVQIERYLDPQDRRFDENDQTVEAQDRFNVDATFYRANLPATRPLEFAYRFRTVGSKRFAPTR